MKAISGKIVFTNNELGVTIEITEYDGVWGHEWSDGYCTHGSVVFKSFDAAYRDAKRVEKNSLEDLRLESI